MFNVDIVTYSLGIKTKMAGRANSTAHTYLTAKKDTNSFQSLSETNLF